jgi:hypothetical protein
MIKMVSQEIIDVNTQQLMLLTDTAAAKKFRESTVLVYDGVKQDKALHEKSQKEYDDAVKAMEQFLHLVLMQDVMSNSYSSAEAVIYLPHKNLKVSYTDPACNGNNLQKASDMEGIVKTTIGDFDPYTWSMILALDISYNPIKLFFDHVVRNLQLIKTKLELHGVRWKRLYVDDSLLTKYNIQDIAGIRSIIYLLCGVGLLREDM